MSDDGEYPNMLQDTQALHGAFYYSHGIDGKFQHVSASVTNVLGYSKDEFLCHEKLYFTDIAANQHVEACAKLSMKGMLQPPYEMAIRHKNGDIKWLLVSETPRRGADGDVIAVDGVALDITQHKLLQNKIISDLEEKVKQQQQTNTIHQQTLKQTSRIRQLWKDTQRSYEAEKARYKKIIQNSFDAIIILDGQGGIREANPAATKIFGWQLREFTKKTINDVIPSFHCNAGCKECFSHVHRAIAFHKDRHKLFLEVVPSLMKIKTETFIAITIRDVSAQEEAETLVKEQQARLESRVSQRTAELKHANDELLILAKKMEQLNCMDQLTCICNRRGFDQEYNKEWARAQRTQAVLTVIMIDIDFFKQFNDFYGHQEGDRCLKEVAATLANSLHRTTDIIARYGGEEFIALLPDSSANGAMHMAELFRSAIEELHRKHAGSAINDYVTISVGVSTCIPQKDMLQDDLIQQADQALYQAKIKRNHIICFTP